MPTSSTRPDASARADDWVCGSEEVAWDAEAHAHAWWQRSASGPYQACVPPAIATLNPPVGAQASAAATEAAVEMARFDAEAANPAMAPLLLLVDAIASSRIEHIRADTSEVAAAMLGARAGAQAGLVASNARATARATAVGKDLSVEAMLDVHETLLGVFAPQHTGKFRERAVWIGTSGSTPHTATFVAPQPERVPGLMADLATFATRTDIAPFVQAAVAHAQFETIHPFPDGNGRAGRALAHGMQRAFGVTRNVVVPFSAGLLSNVRDYYDALAAYRGGDPNPIVEAFTGATFAAVSNGRALMGELAEVEESWRERVVARRDAVVWRALPLVMAQPIVNVAWIATQTEVSLPAAQRAIDQMVEAEVLYPVGENRRSRTWSAGDVLGAVDDFAVRSGRRWNGAISV